MGSGVLRAPVQERLYTTPLTGHFDGLEHHVRDVDQAASWSSGIYRTLCGEAVVPAALTVPGGRPCSGCVAVLIAAEPPAVLVAARRRLLRALLARRRRIVAPAGRRQLVTS